MMLSLSHPGRSIFKTLGPVSLITFVSDTNLKSC